MAKIESVNPYNNQLLASYEQYSDEKIKSIIDEVHNSYDIWCSEDFESRSELLKNLSNHLKANKRHYAELISKEMGKPISQSLSEVEKSASVCDYYAENGESFLSDQIVKSGSDDSIISYQPIGIIFAVMPWNFPFWQVFRCLAPNLMAGNVVILKHA